MFHRCSITGGFQEMIGQPFIVDGMRIPTLAGAWTS